MAWEQVFGEPWFWAAATLVWFRFGLRIGGVPRSLVATALKSAPEELGPASFLRDYARWRLGPGRVTPTGLLPLRMPAAGAAAAFLAAGAAFGDILSFAALTVLGPPLAAVLFLEPQVQKAVDAARDAGSQSGTEQVRLLAFADRLEQLWRVKLAATGCAVLLTVAAAGLTAP